MARVNLEAVITAEDKASGVLNGVGNNIHRGIGGALTALKYGLIAAGTATVAFGGLAVKEFADSENAAAQLNAVLKSTGGIAGITAEQANTLANSLQKVTRFSDEEILSAENMLLTFTKINKDIFPQTTEIALDMSQALGQDLKSSSIQLGKALNDPINGVTALRRVGVQFTDDQEKMIAKMVESGDLMGAQKLILQELQTEFGGSAKAAGETFAGSLDKLKNKLSDLMETIGGSIATHLQPFIDKLNEFAENPAKTFNEALASMRKAYDEKIKPFIEPFTPLISAIKGEMIALASTVKTILMPALGDLAKALGPDGLKLVIGALIIFFGLFLSGILTTTIALRILASAISGIATAIAFMYNFGKGILNAMLEVIIAPYRIGYQIIIGIMSKRNIATIFNDVLNTIKGIGNSIIDGITHPFRVAYKTISDIMNKSKAELNKLNPFHRSSPSLVDRVQAGIGLIKNEYQNLFSDIGANMPKPQIEQSIVPTASTNIVKQQSPINITINGNFLADGVEARRFAEQIIDNMRDIAGARGQTAAELLV